MRQLQEGDLIAIEASGKYYYALILSKIRLFGGNWTYVFHRRSDQLLPLEKVLTMPISGFNAFGDFIWAKREKRITGLARKLDTSGFRGPGRLKATNATKDKAPFWFIMDMNFKELKRVTHLIRMKRQGIQATQGSMTRSWLNE